MPHHFLSLPSPRGFLLLSSSILFLACNSNEQSPQNPAVKTTAAKTTVIAKPNDILDSTWLNDLQAAQRATTDQFKVFHDFHFTDRLPESNIRFIHKIVNEELDAMMFLAYIIENLFLKTNILMAMKKVKLIFGKRNKAI